MDNDTTNISQKSIASEPISENYLEALIANSTDIITVLDVEGIIKFESPSIKTGMGYERGELIGRSAFSLIHPEDLPRVLEKFKKAVEAPGSPQQVEFRFKHKDGSWRYLESIGNFPPKSSGIDGMVINSRDTTQRKEMDKKTEERERLLKEAQVVAGLGIYRTDFVKNKWESSDVLDEIFGIDNNFIRSVEGWASIIHPDDRKTLTDYLQNEVFGKRLNFDKEYRIIQKNSGRKRWVHGLGRMTFDERNRPLTMTGTIQDITERKEIENKLQESEKRYKSLLDSAPLCIKLFDKEGNLVTLNQYGREEHFLQGKTDEEIRNWKYIECIEENYRDLVINKLKEAIEGKSSEFDMEHVPGTTTGGHWCHSSLAPVKNTKGEIQYVLFISRDISSEKEVLRALEEGEQKYKILLDSVPLCIKWFDSKGNLVSVNQHAKEEHFLVEKTDEEIRNWSFMSCIKENFHEKVKSAMATALTGEGSSFEIEHVPGTSTGQWCHSSLAPVKNTKGEIQYVLFISRDVTKEKDADDEKNKTMESLEKFQKLTIDRELKMIELKKEIEAMKEEKVALATKK